MPKTRPLKAQSTLVVKLRPYVPAIYNAQIGSIRCRNPAPILVSVSCWVVKVSKPLETALNSANPQFSAVFQKKSFKKMLIFSLFVFSSFFSTF